MAAIRQKEGIFDRPARFAELMALAARSRTPKTLRGKVLKAMKDAVAEGQREIRKRFEARGRGLVCAQETSYLVDQAVTLLFAFARKHVFGERALLRRQIAVVAVGGYGRGELSPYSDVDLLFLTDDKKPFAPLAEFLLTLLWDIGLKASHAVRTSSETMKLARKDITVRTALLDARFLCGNRPLFDALQRKYAREFLAGGKSEFIQAKLAEREKRHRKTGDSRYTLEPHVKDGKGGLRDLHTIWWLARYCYGCETIADLERHKVFTSEEVRSYLRAQDFLLTMRAHLHYAGGRAEERLSFDMQQRLAAITGFADRRGIRRVERFMKRYFLIARDVGNLTRVMVTALEEEFRGRPRMLAWFERAREVEGFPLRDGRLDIPSAAWLKRDPLKILGIFRATQTTGLELHPHALGVISKSLALIGPSFRKSPEAGALFVEILTSPKKPGATLRRMNEVGVLGQMAPEFGRIVGQMQFNTYHVYTVDEHTLHAISILNDIDQGRMTAQMPLASRKIGEISSRRVLYLALLLHDVAKGQGGGHSEAGAEIAREVALRLGFSTAEAEDAAWLVRHHLLMSQTAFKRDLGDAKTVQDFVREAQSLERLKLLLLLTVADIMAVGPGIWNDWKGALLRELYWRAEETLGSGGGAPEYGARVQAAQEAIAAKLTSWSKKETASYFEQGYSAFWLAFAAEEHAEIARMVKAVGAGKTPLSLKLAVDTAQAVTVLTVVIPSFLGLFTRIAGALAQEGASIVHSRIFTLKNDVAVDRFLLQDAGGGTIERPEKLARITEALESALLKNMPLDDKLLEKRSHRFARSVAAFDEPPRVFFDNEASGIHTVVEVNGRDHIGFLYKVARTLSELEINIASAHISTYGTRAVDVFYVKDRFGHKIESEEMRERIRARLAEALGKK